MERLELPRTGYKPLTFRGKLVALVSTCADDPTSPNYSQTPGRDATVYVYRTSKGQYVQYSELREHNDDGVTVIYDAIMFSYDNWFVGWLRDGAPLPQREKESLRDQIERARMLDNATAV